MKIFAGVVLVACSYHRSGTVFLDVVADWKHLLDLFNELILQLIDLKVVNATVEINNLRDCNRRAVRYFTPGNN